MSIYRMRTEFGKHLKIVMALIAAVFIIGAVWQFGAAPVSQKGPEEDTKPLAIVNGIPIMKSEFDAQWVRMSNEAADRGMRSTMQMADLRAQIFEQLVQERLLLSAAREMGVAPSKKDVENRIDKLVVDQLKENRRAVLGTLDKEQEELDPRKDRKYKSVLSDNGTSLAAQEEMARRLVPPAMVESQLAIEGIQKAINAKIGKIDDKAIKDSYNVYKVRQVVISEGKLPKDQVATRAKNVASEAKKGADFAKLVKDNSDEQFKNQGVIEYSLDMPWMLPPEVGDAVKKMKPGQVSDALKVGESYYVVKLEGVTSKAPAKLDKKTKDERRERIKQMAQWNAGMELQKKIQESKKIKVDDPEMAGYYYAGEARTAMMTDQAKYRKQIALAIQSLEKAVKIDRGNIYATAKLAELYRQEGKNDKAIAYLKMLLGPDSSAQGSDLRMMLGDLLSVSDKPEDKAEALEQYKQASEGAVVEREIHQQLVSRFQQLGQPELAAAEQAWLDDYDKKMAALQAEQQKKMEEQAKKDQKADKSDKSPKPKKGG